MNYLNINLNECDCELLFEALKNNNLSMLGEQSTDLIMRKLEKELHDNNKTKFLVDELNKSIKLLREYCDGGTSCDKCMIKDKIHCTYKTTFNKTQHVSAPFIWSENN
jgi:hypothetical protein